MTDMERDIAGRIMAWAMFNDKIPLANDDGSFITTEQLTQWYWNEYFQSCEMAKPETGFEVI